MSEKREYVLIAEAALGKELPKGTVVHHVDGNRLNNSPNNLVICQDQTYHQLIHQRQKSLEESGHPDWRKCKFCKNYDAPENLKMPKKARNSAYHLQCDAEYSKEARRKKGTISFEKRRERWGLIKQRLAQGTKIDDLISEFGLSHTTITRIRRDGVNR